MTDERVVIVDEHDRVIGSMLRRDRTYTNIYRIAALWLTNSRGQILLAQRSLKKDFNPGKWGPAAAGTVAKGESYEENIYREAEEEIGLSGLHFSLGPKMFWDSGKHQYFCQWFIGLIDRDEAEFVLQETEVEQVAWVEKADLISDLDQNPSKFVSSHPAWKNYFL